MENISTDLDLREHFSRASELINRQRGAADFVMLGGYLQALISAVADYQRKALGDVRALRQAASICFNFFDLSLGISTARARAYLRCYERFSDNPEAARHFTIKDLTEFAATSITAGQITALSEAKSAYPEMSHEQFKALLKTVVERGDNAPTTVKDLVDTLSAGSKTTREAVMAALDELEEVKRETGSLRGYQADQNDRTAN